MIRLAILLFCCFVVLSCSKDSVTPDPTLETKMEGNWQVVDLNGDKIAVEWGLLYVATVKINADHTFGVDGGKTGTWKMQDSKTVIFNSDITSAGIHQTSTDAFSISFNTNNQLILKNAKSAFYHNRITN